MLDTAIFLTVLAVTFYIIIGYPLLLGLRACLIKKPVLKKRQQKSVSILVAVRNGEQFIANKLTSVLQLNYPPELIEIIVVSDGSTDRTVSIAQGLIPDKIRVIEIPRAGKCAALNEAISHAKNEILLLTDVRQMLAPDSLQTLIDCFGDPSVGVVSGELKICGGCDSGEVSTGLYRRYEDYIRKTLSAIDSTFGATGAFYAIRRTLAVPLPPDILLDDMYLPLAAFFNGYRLIHEPTAQVLDYPTSRSVEFKRKVRTLAGNYQILFAYPALLGPQNRMWFHYVSYKFARLILPWLLVVLFLSSCFLPAPWNWAALGSQALLYVPAILDPWVPDSFAVKRLSSMTRTVVAMLLAAMCSISVLFRPPKSLWRETKIDPSHL